MEVKSQSNFFNYFFYAGGIICLLIFAYLTYQTITLKASVVRLSHDLSETNSQKEQLMALNASTSASLQIATDNLNAISSQLSLTSDQLSSLEDDYKAEKNKNDSFQNQINKISGTVGSLDKLSKTDKELLQKYSKVYFLNENYIPEKLVQIDKKYLYTESVPKEIHAKVEPFLNDMLDAALDDNVKIWVVSAYRSFGTQAALKNSYSVTYGTGANAFSADQGYSEHQLGTTLDFTTEGINGGLDGFDATAAYTWLQKNAYKYGFILSYPQNNSYYEYEPWHWRFVGQDLAKYLHTKGVNFYDVDQRTIDTYLISIFD